MKVPQTILLSIILLFTFSLVYSYNSQQDIPQGITNALQTGNSQELAKYFDASVELVILNNDNVYSKSQAEQILKNFFNTHKPDKFTLVHEGGKQESTYAIGTLKTNNGTFRVYFLLKQTNNKYYIHQLRIENEAG